jgi:hypothetical protein
MSRARKLPEGYLEEGSRKDMLDTASMKAIDILIECSIERLID